MGDENRKESDGPVQVYIFNQTYNLRSGSDEEYVRRVARIVDERMRQISSLAPNHDALKVAVLAALHIADELERVKETRDEEQEQAPRAHEEDAEPERQTPSADSWFDNIFETELTGNRDSDSLSTRVARRLHTRRGERRAPITIEPDEQK